MNMPGNIQRPILVEVRRNVSQRTDDTSSYRKNTKQLEPPIDTSTLSDLDEIPSKTKWSSWKKLLFALLITVIACIVILAIVLPVVLTRNRGETTTTTSAVTISSTVISAFWSFDATTADAYGVYNGIMINGATFTAVSTTQPYLGNGRALSVSSSSSQSFQVSQPFFNLASTSFTIEAWIYATTSFTGDSAIFGQCQCSTCINQCFYFIIRTNRLYVSFTFNDLPGTTTLTSTVWYHTAFVYNYETNQQILYLNGVQDAIQSNAQPYQGQNATIQIGSAIIGSLSAYFNGYIDNVKVTTRAKSAAEILNAASLTAYYSFDLPSPNVDNGPNGLNGSSVNTVTALGRVNQAMYFTGSSSYFQAYGFYQAGYGVFTNKPFSISMWINPSAVASCAFVQQSTTQSSGGQCLNMAGLYSANGLAGQLLVQTYGFPGHIVQRMVIPCISMEFVLDPQVPTVF